jgi:hypothetical protein
MLSTLSGSSCPLLPVLCERSKRRTPGGHGFGILPLRRPSFPGQSLSPTTSTCLPKQAGMMSATLFVPISLAMFAAPFSQSPTPLRPSPCSTAIKTHPGPRSITPLHAFLSDEPPSQALAFLPYSVFPITEPNVAPGGTSSRVGSRPPLALLFCSLGSPLVPYACSPINFMQEPPRERRHPRVPPPATILRRAPWPSHLLQARVG